MRESDRSWILQVKRGGALKMEGAYGDSHLPNLLVNVDNH